ncbi:MAG TPA: ABC transporter ATP-binding protein [Anaerovoracaceae bacterium]|nr:ABC transporter ATP-binding protein [Anaerovoracaceae bacterium]
MGELIYVNVSGAVIHLEPVLEMKQILKIYPNGVMANNEVDFSVRPGEIHALVGENGAGKTTLMKILFGIEQPTGGTISIYGKTVKIHSVSEALQLGLGMVQQHFMLVPSMTVAENIVLGSEPVKGFLLDKAEAVRVTKELCEKYSFDIDVSARVDDLPVGDKQKVEILKVLFRKAKVLILDEPTAVLTPQETEELFKQLLILKEQGHTIVFISHKLREVQELCDRVTIMRKSKTVGVYRMADISIDKISEYMIGQEVTAAVNTTPPRPGEVRLNASHLTYITENNKKAVNDVCFSLRSGVIVGMVGVEGNGQKELVDMLTGAREPSSGTIEISGTNIAGKGIRQIRDLSVAYIPQERMETGVAQDCSITENIASYIYQKRDYRIGPLLRWRKLAKTAKQLISDYQIKANSEETTVRMLSGGNIQKVVVAREFMDDPALIIADQPTRGIDVGAASLIHNKLLDLRDKGAAVLLISSDLTEVMSLSDSIIVLYGGRICAWFPDTDSLQESDLGLYMLGVRSMSEEEIGRCFYA